MRRSVHCTALFSVCSLRRAKFPIIYPDLRLDYKVATHPFWELQKGQNSKAETALDKILFRNWYLCWNLT